MDAVQAANSGHPGMPMGAADMATVLFTKYLKYDPADPNWPDRDDVTVTLSDAGHTQNTGERLLGVIAL